MLETLRAGLSGQPDLDLAYLFGSQARGESGKTSDVDVAVLFGHPIDLMKLGALQEGLSELLGRPVDLVDLRTAGPLLTKEVVSDGQLIVSRSPGFTLQFELRAIRVWEDTKVLRRQQQDLLRELSRHGRAS